MKTSSPKLNSAEKAAENPNTFPVVAIGASAGGLEAMLDLLKYLPADTGMAFIYVQHLSPDHKSMLTEILSKKTSMIVQEIDDMDKIVPDNLFIIPHNKGIEVVDGHIQLIPRSESSAAISIDILFSSLAESQKDRVIGIILSGSASDGTIGMKAIKQEGGLTFAQDDSARFTSMPHSAIAAGTVDFVLSPKEIALELARLSKHPLIKSVALSTGEENVIANSNPALKSILNQLLKATGVDFSSYKMNTIKRRIIRRMLLYKIKELDAYAQLLSIENDEIQILYQDLLINVTAFFRDTETHQYLKDHLLPKILKRKTADESLRIWVPACATGEEAYSIAMTLVEIQESKSTCIPVQIFATDLSEKAISKARSGIYSHQELESVSPNRIQRFFVKAEDGFQVSKIIRDMCIFAPHNILRDPPFSRLDFISCCNLFIYLDNSAQIKVVNAFHYALNSDGFLLLGKSENISHSVHLFSTQNKKYRIFAPKSNISTRTLAGLIPRYAHQPIVSANVPPANQFKKKQSITVNYNHLDNAIDAVLVAEFMPASVVINFHMEIVQFRGNTDLFLTHPKGKATFNILKMARPEIAFDLRSAISKVMTTNQRFRKSGIELNPMKDTSNTLIISIEVVPLDIESDEPLLLILFALHEQIDHAWQHTEGGQNTSLAKDRRIKKLEMELAAAHADALAIAHEQEAFTMELQSAHEEVVSSNEELQTVNEELETSKEEIESANEELITTNQELQTRNDLLNEAYDYSEAVLATLHEPLIVLDKNLRIKSANKTFYKKFNTSEEETVGMLLFDLGNKQWETPRLRELLEEILPKNTHFDDFEISHTFPVIGKKTMLLNARRIKQKRNHEELILLAIADVTEQILAIHEMEKNELQLREAIAAAAAAVKFKQQFLSNMSHEIRTPLNSILGFTNVLLKTQLDPKQVEFIQAIKTSGTSLSQLINDILDLAKVDSGKMTFEHKPFELKKTLTSLLHTFNLKLNEKNLLLIEDYDSRVPSMVSGDSIRLNQILLNLVSNAVKFTHRGTIKLGVKVLSEDKEKVLLEFSVADTGIGIAEDKIKSMFNIFEQAEIDTALSYGGTGLGLAIVKQLVEAQGGSIQVESEVGVGSVFSFTLAFGKTNQLSLETADVLHLNSAIGSLIRVLVAEDIALNQLLIKIILSDFKFEYDIVSNGKLAIEKLNSNFYDIILMDLHMPVMNGFETTAYIRNTLKSNIPIIALTADVTTVDISKCRDFGMNDYISKPIDENLLYNKIVDLVK